jgi:hypothetical protein
MGELEDGRIEKNPLSEAKKTNFRFIFHSQA